MLFNRLPHVIYANHYNSQIMPCHENKRNFPKLVEFIQSSSFAPYMQTPKAKRVRRLRPEYKELSEFIKKKIVEDAGMGVDPFAKRYGLKGPTLDQICRGYYFYDSTKRYKDIELLARALSLATETEITPELLLSKIDRRPTAKSDRLIASVPEKPNPRKLLADLKKIGSQGREEIWKEILEMAAQDHKMRQGMKQISVMPSIAPSGSGAARLERLIEMLRNKMNEEGMHSTTELMRWLVDESRDPVDLEVEDQIKQLLDRILTLEQSPILTDPGFGDTFTRIAELIPSREGISFGGNVDALLVYCGLISDTKTESNGVGAH